MLRAGRFFEGAPRGNWLGGAVAVGAAIASAVLLRQVHRCRLRAIVGDEPVSLKRVVVIGDGSPGKRAAEVLIEAGGFDVVLLGPQSVTEDSELIAPAWALDVVASVLPCAARAQEMIDSEGSGQQPLHEETPPPVHPVATSPEAGATPPLPAHIGDDAAASVDEAAEVGSATGEVLQAEPPGLAVLSTALADVPSAADVPIPAALQTTSDPIASATSAALIAPALADLDDDDDDDRNAGGVFHRDQDVDVDVADGDAEAALHSSGRWRTIETECSDAAALSLSLGSFAAEARGGAAVSAPRSDALPTVWIHPRTAEVAAALNATQLAFADAAAIVPSPVGHYDRLGFSSGGQSGRTSVAAPPPLVDEALLRHYLDEHTRRVGAAQTQSHPLAAGHDLLDSLPEHPPWPAVPSKALPRDARASPPLPDSAASASAPSHGVGAGRGSSVGTPSPGSTAASKASDPGPSLAEAGRSGGAGSSGTLSSYADDPSSASIAGMAASAGSSAAPAPQLAAAASPPSATLVQLSGRRVASRALRSAVPPASAAARLLPSTRGPQKASPPSAAAAAAAAAASAARPGSGTAASSVLFSRSPQAVAEAAARARATARAMAEREMSHALGAKPSTPSRVSHGSGVSGGASVSGGSPPSVGSGSAMAAGRHGGRRGSHAGVA